MKLVTGLLSKIRAYMLADSPPPELAVTRLALAAGLVSM